MQTLVPIMIDQAKEDLKNNGFALLKGFFKDNEKLSELNGKIHELICLKAKQNSIELPDNNQESVNDAIMKLHTTNDKFGSFLNETLNCFPELHRILGSKEIHSLAQSILGNPQDCILGNNFRFRSQISGRD